MDVLSVIPERHPIFEWLGADRTDVIARFFLTLRMPFGHVLFAVTLVREGFITLEAFGLTRCVHMLMFAKVSSCPERSPAFRTFKRLSRAHVSAMVAAKSIW